MDYSGSPNDPVTPNDPATGEYVSAVARVRRLLRTTWDPDGTLVVNSSGPGAYDEQARHLASLVWLGEPPEFLADYLAAGGVETDARPALAREDLISLAQAIIRLASATRPSA